MPSRLSQLIDDLLVLGQAEIGPSMMHLEQALTNLVSNAIKFTPKGGEVEISVRNDAETVQVRVTDTGMGIEPTELDRIFDRFYRSTTTVDAAVKGTGLGLAIAKKMIEAQNGQICVTSTVGRGSTFTITFPRTPATLQVA